jgi:putative MATE family efflux protein
MVIQTASVLLNMGLAPILIFGWGTGRPMGVAGAAVASLVSVAAGAGALVGYLVRAERYVAFVAADLRPRLVLWGRMLKIGLPAGAEFAFMGVYFVVVYAVTRPFGSAAQAGFGIGLRLVQAMFLPVVALGFAVSPVAGRNYGAGQPERVRATFRTGAAMAVAAMAVLTLACQLGPEAMIRLFSHDPQVLAVGGQYLRIVSFNFVASGIIFVSSSMFQAMGNTVPSLVSSFGRMVLLVIPTYWLSRLPGFQLRWVWILSAGSTVLQMVANLLLLLREYRLRLEGPEVVRQRATSAG